MGTANDAVTTPMPRYKSHKKVWALKITSVQHLGADTTTDENALVRIYFDPPYAPQEHNLRGKPTPEAGWYMVQYDDGYISFSPAQQFENGYTRYSDSQEFGDFRSFGWAIKQLQNGSRVCRGGWNGKGMFVFLVPGSCFTVNRAPLNTIYPEGTLIDYRSHIDMKTADGSIVPWVASQTDMLATDWQIAG